MKAAGALLFASTLLTGTVITPAGPVRAAHHFTSATSPTAPAALRLAPAFEQNMGQAPRNVEFLVRGDGTTLYLSARGATLHAPRGTDTRLTYAGTDSAVRPQGVHRLPGRMNYLIGRDPKGWHTDIPTFAAVRYRNLYPGIDLLYHGAGKHLEYDWILRPGTHPGAIRLRLSGGGRAGIDLRGNLIMQGTGGGILQSAPAVYQTYAGARHTISSHYTLGRDGTVGVAVGRYDALRPLVIDPVLKFATYLGGANVDHAYGVAVDSAGDIFMTGDSMSDNLPAPTHDGTSHVNARTGDAFVLKMNPAGNAILYTTYIGGDNVDESYRVALDAAGEATVVGETISRNFPLAHPFQTSYGGGGSDAFIARLNARGDGLIYSSYMGGSGDDFASDLALDAHGAAYITGDTHSPNLPLLHPLQSKLSGESDAFVFKVAGAGTLEYSTYFGGNSIDSGSGIAVDPAGDVYLTGLTYSKTFPLVHPLLYEYRGGFDAFVTKIDSAGASVVFSSYLGAGDTSFGNDIALDTAGNVYIAGQTNSLDFPLVRAWQKTYGGGDATYFSGDAFLVKINPDLTGLLYSTYLGGKRDDSAVSIVVDGRGYASISGYTNSANFPVKDAFQPRFIGTTCRDIYAVFPCNDGFVATFTPSGSLAFSTFIGGSANDAAMGIALGPGGSIVAVGTTDSTDFHTVHALQPANASSLEAGTDTFVLRIVRGPTRIIEPYIALDGARLLHSVGGRMQPTDMLKAGEAGQFELSYHILAGGKHNASAVLRIQHMGKLVLRTVMAPGLTAEGFHVFRASVKFPGATTVDRLVAHFSARLGTAKDSRTLAFSVGPRP